jgi:nicotinate dehydrogenase subunit A
MNSPVQSNEVTVAFAVNGRNFEVRAPEDTPLLMALRHDLGLKGTRIGCAEGHCGACTVLTIEDLATDRAGQQLQSIFLTEQAAQCGYCTNGIIMTVAGMLAREPAADRAEIIAALDERHLCRCGSQLRILRAVDRAIAERQGRRT